MCVKDGANGRVYWRKENHGKLFSVNCPHGDNTTGYRNLYTKCKDSPLEISENAIFVENNEGEESGVLSCAEGFKLVATDSQQCFGNGLTIKCQDNQWTSAILAHSKAPVPVCQPVCEKDRCANT